MWTSLWIDVWTENGGVLVSIAEGKASVEVSELTPEEAAAFDRIARGALDLTWGDRRAAPDSRRQSSTPSAPAEAAPHARRVGTRLRPPTDGATDQLTTSHG
jgi:hypothetical protein